MFSQDSFRSYSNALLYPVLYFKCFLITFGRLDGGKKIEFLVAIMVKNVVTRFPPDGVSRGPAELSDPNLLLIFMSRIFLFITHHQ